MILMRWGFLGSMVTARHRQSFCSPAARISFSIAARIVPAVALARPSSSIRDVSMVQYRVSVNVEGVVFIEVSVRTLLGWLVGGVRATCA
jgi:hypothetical protein